MRFVNFCGKSKIALPVNGIPADMKFDGGRTSYRRQVSLNPFGPHETACFKAKSKKGGPFIRLFANGTVTFMGMRSAAQANDAVAALGAAIAKGKDKPKKNRRKPHVEITRTTGVSSANLKKVNRIATMLRLRASGLHATFDLGRYAAVIARCEGATALIYRNGSVVTTGKSPESVRDMTKLVTPHITSALQ